MSQFARARTRIPLQRTILSLALGCMTMPLAAQTTPASEPVKKAVKKDQVAAPVKTDGAIKPDEKGEAPAAPVSSDAIVSVQGQRPSNRIDRQVYDVKSDVAASNSSAADALNNVPSVAVDPDGTVTLRGSTNVQVYIDGKRSAMLSGDNRAATLASMPAEDIESVEVINNPGAQFGNDGGGGPILNLVMRRNRRAGGFGSLSANIGNGGRYNTSLSGNYNTGRLSFQGGAYLRHETRDTDTDSDRLRIDPAAGTTSRSTQAARSDTQTRAAGFNTGITYNLGDKDTLGAGLSFARRSTTQDATDRYISYGTDTIADRDYIRSTSRDVANDNLNFNARFEHKGDTPGESAKMDLRLSSTTNDTDSAFANLYSIGLPTSGALQSHQLNQSDTRVADLTGDYELPAEFGLLRLGYKAVRDRNLIDTRLVDIDPVTQAETLNQQRSNTFALRDTTLAVYGSLERRFANVWGLQGGLRAEHTKVKVAQMTSAVDAANDYFNLIPSMFVTYKASEDTDFRFAYAHRIRRPGANDLNPFIIYRDEFNVSSGNPNLRPTKTDSFELSWETNFGPIDTNLRGYFRKDSGIIAERKVFISDTVLLTTRDNAGSNRAGGLEFTLRGKLAPQWTLNASGNLAYTEQRIFGANVGADAKRSTPSLSGRLRLNYQSPQLGQLQMAINAQGKTLTRQGYRKPITTANLSYRLPLTATIHFVVNLTDIFDSGTVETITDTDLIKDNTVSRSNGRTAFIGLMLRFGGVSGFQGGGPGDGQRRPPSAGGQWSQQAPPPAQ